jgi:alpha-N-acetylglucosaminidase
LKIQSIIFLGATARCAATIATLLLMVQVTFAVDSNVKGAGQVSGCDAIQAADALIMRVLPGHAGEFVCEIISQDAGRDVFEIGARNGKVLLRGNDGVSLAMAFNWYLRRETKTSYDRQADGPLVIVGTLPLPKTVTRQVCLARERLFLNYCTYGYAFPFMRSDGWERFVDWMAMNGINRPLMQCGQEAVWLKVWQSYGIPKEQVLAYFPGPAHLPWHRMSNLDKFDGPLPMSYIEGQMRLEQQLLKQARGLGMKPILSAFTGHVPEALKTVQPAAAITQIKPGWGGLPPANACWFLKPTDPLFAQIQGRFLKAQAELYGTDHLYAADPFNEIDPPSWAPDYITGVGHGIYKTMTDADPVAHWYLMSWTFTYDGANWLKKNSDGVSPFQTFCQSIPTGKMTIIDYVCEERELYRETRNCCNAPFLWSYVGNYGGNTYFRAPIDIVSRKVAQTLAVENCAGVASVPEGMDCNPGIYEMLFEQPWHPQGVLDVKAWLAEYAACRARRDDPQVIQAWEILRSKVLDCGPQGHFDRGSALTKNPPNGTNDVAPPRTALADEAPERQPELERGLVEAIDTLLAATPESQQADGYQYDLVNWVRQALAYQTDVIMERIRQARKQHSHSELTRQTRLMLDILRDMDELTGTRHEFLLGRWIRDARAWGDDPVEADYYEHNARQIITAWGGNLRDYARREWNGLLRDYYLQRWEVWAKQNTPEALGNRWVDEKRSDFVTMRGGDYATEPVGDPVVVARRIFAKYRGELLEKSGEISYHVDIGN